jgi:hypothetical protein
MIYALIASLVLLLAIPLPTNAQYFGQFTGMAIVEFLPDGRRMRLTKDFSYIDPAGGRWTAPAGSVVDGASIPKFAWSLIGGPFEGRYRDASVIHDIACINKDRPWELVHLTFYNAMRASDVDPTLARFMYAAVYHFGPRWTYTYATNAIKDLDDIKSETDKIKRTSDSNSRIVVRRRNPLYEYRGEPSEVIELIVIPSATYLSQENFARLQAAIKSRETSALGEMSLEEIRNFK